MTDFLQQLAVFLRVAGTRNGPKTRTPPLFCITWKYLTGPVVARRGPSWPVVTRRGPSDLDEDSLAEASDVVHVKLLDFAPFERVTLYEFIDSFVKQVLPTGGGKGPQPSPQPQPRPYICPEHEPQPLPQRVALRRRRGC